MHALEVLLDNDAFNHETLISTLIGIAIGAVASFIVNIALVEISLSSVFAVYYGLFFALVGSILIYNAYSKTNGTMVAKDDFAAKRPTLLGFGVFIVLSGILCVILDKNWFATISPTVKVPLYMILGSSICFVVVLSIVDVVNYIGGHLRRMNYRSLIDTPSQILALTIISLTTGAIYGLMFGWMRVENVNHFTAQIVIFKEEKYCLVAGVILGAIGGILNELIRRNIAQQLLKKSAKDPFAQEI